MARGTNYLNNNKGVSLQASKKPKGSKMVECSYGAGCTRKGCIYSHPFPKTNNSDGSTSIPQSMEPCMAYLAGECSFTSKGCRKRHPSNEECERLIEKYKTMNCRFGDNCQTKACLYKHPWDVDQEQNADTKGDDFGYDAQYHSYNYYDSHQQQQQQQQLSKQDLMMQYQYHQHQQQIFLQQQQMDQQYGYAQNNDYTSYDQTYMDHHSSTNYQNTTADYHPTSYQTTYTQASSTIEQPQSEQDEENFQKQKDGVNINAKEFVPGSWGN